MVRVFILIALCAALSAALLPVRAGVLPVDGNEAANWIRYTVPLPKKIEIRRKVEVAADRVAIVVQAEKDLVTDQALKELRESLGVSESEGPTETPEFTISLQLGGPEADMLKSLKNSDQAYRIFAPSQDGKELRLVALTSNGLYYAVKTLDQLIAPEQKGKTVTVPVLEVTDWPDMQKRGLWGTDNFNHLRWLADRKMNLMEQISNCGVDDSGKPFARLQDKRDSLCTEGPNYGIEFSPVILHLEQSSQHGTIKMHPELKGKSDHPGVLCYSQPGVSDIIADWMVQLASLPHVTSIDAWMTENLGKNTGCQCDLCKGKEWPVLEAKAVLAAWKKAQEKLGRPFTLRLMTAEATEDSNVHVFAALPPEVQRAYYHSLLTYNSFRRPQLRPYLAREAKHHWLGVVPNVSPTVGFCEPFTGAAFIHYRMNEFVDKGLSGLLGYATPRVHYYRFNVEAAAEWTWNAKGRSTREFALSYAVRQGYKDPKKFADWSETMGPVGWDVYGSGFPNEERRGAFDTVAVKLRKGTLPPLGFILWDAYPAPWGNIETEQQLNDDVKAAARGLRMAKQLGIPEILYESQVVDGYIRAMKALYELKGFAARHGVPVARKDEAHRWYLQYVDGLECARKGLSNWEKTVITATEPEPYTKKPVDTITKMLHEMRDTALAMGF